MVKASVNKILLQNDIIAQLIPMHFCLISFFLQAYVQIQVFVQLKRYE